MTPIPTELRELLEQFLDTSVDQREKIFEQKKAIRALLATPPADAADMGGQAGEDRERNRAFKACPNSGCDWGAFYLGWKAKAKDLVSIRAALESQHRQRSGKLVEALGLTVLALDQLLPYLSKVPADVGLINEALVAARPLLEKQPSTNHKETPR